jgi:hypothetical protein
MAFQWKEAPMEGKTGASQKPAPERDQRSLLGIYLMITIA